MSPKNLNVSKKTHNFLFNKLKDKRTLQIYKKFESELGIKSNFIVAVSGGPDSLALSFLAKIYSTHRTNNMRIIFLTKGMVPFQKRVFLFTIMWGKDRFWKLERIPKAWILLERQLPKMLTKIF